MSLGFITCEKQPYELALPLVGALLPCHGMLHEFGFPGKEVPQCSLPLRLVRLINVNTKMISKAKEKCSYLSFIL